MPPIESASERFFTAFYHWAHLTSIESYNLRPQHLTCYWRQSARSFATQHRRLSTLTKHHSGPRQRTAGLYLASSRSIKNGAREPAHYHATQSQSSESPTSKRSQPNSIQEDVRTIFRSLTHPVTVITTSALQAGHKTLTSVENYRGVTVSSLTSVTLKPVPILSFNLKVPSRTWDALVVSGILRVHVLAASTRGAAVANAFTKPYDDAAEPFRQLELAGASIFDGFDPENSAPTIRWGDGVVATIHAQVLKDKCVHIGDHVVVFAEVRMCSYTDGGKGIALGHALSYSSGNYGQTSQIIRPEELSIGNTKSQPVVQGDEDCSHSGRAKPSSNGQGDEISNRPEDAARYRTRSNRDKREWPIQGTVACGKAKPATMQSVLTRSESSRRISDGHPISSNDSSSTRFITSSARQCGSGDHRPFNSIELANMVTSPTILRKTVAEFLTEDPDAFHPPPRMLEVNSAKRAAAKATKALAIAEKKGTLTADQSYHLQNEIAQKERAVTVRIAQRAAIELKSILDRGIAGAEHTQWLENAIEKGEVALLEEIESIQTANQTKALNEEKYEMIRRSLESKLNILRTETMRLRAMAFDEDNDDD